MKRVFMLLVAMSIVVSMTEALFGATIRVPQDQPTIQAGINAAANGDTVLVAPGTYTQSLSVNKSIYLISSGGASSTTIFPTAPAVRTINVGGASDGVFQLTGFTVRGARSADAAVRVDGPAYILTDNVFRDNHGGGNVLLTGPSGKVLRNKIADNSGGGCCGIWTFGGNGIEIADNQFSGNFSSECSGIRVDGGSGPSRIHHNLLFDNSNTSNGYASALNVNGDWRVYNNTVANNGSSVATAALWVGNSGIDVRNNIVTSNVSCDGIRGASNAMYNDSWNNGLSNFASSTLGEGNLSVDPMFENVQNGNYRLQVNSPCIDKGDPNPQYNDADGSRNDIGAIEFGPRVFISHIELRGETDLSHVHSFPPIFEWSYFSIDPFVQTSFEIAVGTDNDWQFAEMWNPATFVSADTFVVYGGIPLVDGETYRLRLRIDNNLAWSLWEELQFRMNSLPTVPELLSPAAGEIVENGPPSLTLRNSTDAENDSLYYIFEISGDNFASVLYRYTLRQSPDTVTTALIDSALSINTQYQWRAKASDYYEESNWSPIWSFNYVQPKHRFVDCANGDDNATGTFNDPFRTIAQAINVVDSSDTIFVFPGECVDTLVIRRPIRIISLEGPELTTIRALPGYRSILISGVTEDTVRIEGFTITGGNPSQPEDPFLNGGGGILAHFSLVSIEDCIVTGNSAASAGGGILLRKNTDFRLTNSTICHNQTPTSSGGGIATVDAAGGVIERTTISGNSAELNGGGVFFFAGTPEYYGRDFVMRNSVVINNLATEGGAGIGARRSDLDLRNTIVVNNQRGGGVNDLFGVYASESDLITNNDYNDVWGNVGGLDFDPAIIVGSHSLSVDPQFVGDTTCAATALDFCSKLVDTGDPLILPLAGGGVRSDIGRADVSSSECEYRPNRVWVGAAEYVDCQRLKLPVWIVNDLDTIAAVTTPLNWSHAGLIYDSVRWQNSRVANWEFKLVTANNAARTILLGATRLVAPALLPDSGLFCEVFFHANGIAEGAAICVDSGYIAPGGEFIFSDIYARTLYPGFTTHCFDYWPPCALVIAPNGGEVYVGLNSESVMWRFLDDDADSTAVWLSIDGGATYPRYLGSVAGADTTLTWSVPILWEEDCKVRVKNYRPAGIVEGDVSDNLFSIHSIGDTDCSNRIDIADIVCMINFMFPAGTDPCTCIERARDANCDGRFNISDAVHMVNYIFASGPPPCPDNLPAAKMHRPAVDICRDAAVRGEELTVTIASVFDLAAVEWEIDIPMADVKAVRLGGAAEGMQLYQSRLAGGRLKIGVIDLTGEHSIGAGEVIRIELICAVDLESISLTGIVVDREAVAYDVSANLKSAARPASYTLEQNQPNPFNPQTTIKFTIVEPEWTEVVVFNVLGEEVRRLMAGSLAAGAHSVTWDSRDDSGASLPSGVYFYRLTSGDFSATRKMLLLK